MNEPLTTASLKAAIESISSGMEARIEELNRLDGEVGDGDLGVTISRGLEGLRQVSDDLPADVGAALSSCARAIIAVSGSTFGTLIATGLLDLGRSVRGRTSIPLAEILPLLRSSVDAVKTRSGAQSGDKTAVDALEAIVTGIQEADTGEQAKDRAAQACRQALADFRARPCRQGRARIFGEKTQGRDDPGMLAICYIVDSL